MLDARFAFLRPLTFGPLPAGDALGDFLPFDLGLDLGFDFRLEPRVRDRLVPVCELPIRVTQRVSLHRRREVPQQLFCLMSVTFYSKLFWQLQSSLVCDLAEVETVESSAAPMC